MSYGENDDDGVSSGIGTDSLTTPPVKGHVSIEPNWSGAMASATHVPLLPSHNLTEPLDIGKKKGKKRK